MNIRRKRIVPAYDDAFYRRFPNLFAGVLAGDKSVSPITDWGVECGIGWRARVVEPLCEKLEAMIAELPEKMRGGYRATQVKEKFAVLRFYMTRATAEMLSAISDAEDVSQGVCELCGKDSDECGCAATR